MWFPTRDKVEREIQRLLTVFELIEKRAARVVAKSNIFSSILGPNEIAETIHRNALQIIENLYAAAAQVRFGMRSVKQVASDLTGVETVGKNYNLVLDNMESNTR
jgi:hypothetical protein